MAVNVRRFIAAGFDRLYWGVNDGNGYVMGKTGSTLASSKAGEGMGYMDGVKTANVSIPEPEVVSLSGTDGFSGAFIFPASQSPTFDIITSVEDLDQIAKYQGTETYEEGDISIGTLMPDEYEYPDISLILLRRGKSKSSGSKGTSNWNGLIIPMANIIPLGSDGLTERGAAAHKYRVICQPASMLPWGRAINQTNFKTTGAVILPFTSENRIHVHSFKQDGSGTLLEFGPLEYTAASAAKVRVFSNGVYQGSTTLDSANEITPTPAIAANAKVTVLYEHL